MVKSATKGQEISKAIYDVKTSSKKWTKLTILSKKDGQDSVIGSFFGRSLDTVKCFWYLLTFKKFLPNWFENLPPCLIPSGQRSQVVVGLGLVGGWMRWVLKSRGWQKKLTLGSFTNCIWPFSTLRPCLTHILSILCQGGFKKFIYLL